MSRFEAMMPYKSSSPSRHSGGFTLVETIVYVGVFSIMLVTLSAVYANALNSQELSRAGARLLHNQKKVELFLFSRLEEAQTVTTPASGTTTKLVISSPTSSENPVTFEILSGAMTMKLGTGTPIALTTSDVTVTSFSAVRGTGTPSSVMITVNYSAQALGRTFTSTTSFTQTLRYE